jgi:hypothetical protein
MRSKLLAVATALTLGLGLLGTAADAGGGSTLYATPKQLANGRVDADPPDRVNIVLKRPRGYWCLDNGGRALVLRPKWYQTVSGAYRKGFLCRDVDY